MVPMMLAVGLFAIETGKPPVRFGGAAGLGSFSLPTNFDTLPVLLAHGGSDGHNRSSIPQIRGFWPPEANKEGQWPYYSGLQTDQAWTHLQQEFTWIQSPDSQQRRVFLWAEAPKVTSYNPPSATWNQKFQTMDTAKKRGVLVMNPVTGKVHVPAILNPAADVDHGMLFGAEFVLGTRANFVGSYNYIYYEGCTTMKAYYYAIEDTPHERMAHMHGGGTFLQQYSNVYGGSPGGYYMASLGRTATTVAMSADGVWCATALVGNASGGTNEQKILLWRNDNQAIPAAIFAQAFAEAVPGIDEDGTTALTNRAVILKVGGETPTGGAALSSNQAHLLPDSLMFVEGGLLFLNETQLDRVFGVSLFDGHISSISLATRVGVGTAGTGVAVNATYGQYVPDNDKVVACFPSTAHGAQFSFAGNKPAAGAAGPKRVAFVAGTMNLTSTYNETTPYSASYPGPTGGYLGSLSDLTASTYPRQGYAQNGNANKSLCFIDLTTTGGSLELSTSTLRDLTGSSAAVYGDLLTPGRFGEELDRLVLSDDGNYCAVVREVSVGGYLIYYYYGYYGGFANAYYYYMYPGSSSSYPGWCCSMDGIITSTSGADMDSGTSGTQHVLFLGSGNHGTSNSTASPKGGMPSYAIQQAHFNGSLRRIFGMHFAPDGRKLIMNYSAGNYYTPNWGYPFITNYQGFNPSSNASYGAGDEISISLNFRTSAGAAADFTSGSNVTNNLAGLTGTSSVGQTSAPYGETTSQQCFWANFISEDGRFMYYISDQVDSSTTFTAANRNHMVGFNMTTGPIGLGTTVSPIRQPYTPFSTHTSATGFEQFDCNAWNYEGRFAWAPGGVASPAGPDAKGILCVIGSDTSAGAGSATDLEVYVMNTNLGTNLVNVTSSVTTGTANAINHLYMSCDGNMVAGKIAKTTATSATSRSALQNNTSIFVVTNLHAVLAGATPNALIVSDGQSHGTTVAFVGDGTPAGPQALIFSSTTASTSNTSWPSRTMKSVFLASGAVPSVIDSTQSVYAVIAGTRKTNDVAATSD
jgi:hypothetical protein